MLVIWGLQSCLPNQLDLCRGQLWADGQSTSQLHQQRQVSAFTEGSVVVPPDSEIVAPVSIRSPVGIPLGRCSLIEPDMMIRENYVVLVGRPLVDTSNWSAEVLFINPGSDVVVLPQFSCVGSVVQVSAVTVARTLSTQPEATPPGPLPPHLEEIVAGSHPSLGVDGCGVLTDILHKYSHVFLVPGDPVTGRTKVVLHKIDTNGARPARCVAWRWRDFGWSRIVFGTCWKRGKLNRVIVRGRHLLCWWLRKTGPRVLCRLLSVECYYSEGRVPVAPYRWFTGSPAVVFHDGLGQWLLAGSHVSGC